MHAFITDKQIQVQTEVFFFSILDIDIMYKQ